MLFQRNGKRSKNFAGLQHGIGFYRKWWVLKFQPVGYLFGWWFRRATSSCVSFLTLPLTKPCGRKRNVQFHVPSVRLLLLMKGWTIKLFTDSIGLTCVQCNCKPRWLYYVQMHLISPLVLCFLVLTFPTFESWASRLVGESNMSLENYFPRGFKLQCTWPEAAILCCQSTKKQLH